MQYIGDVAVGRQQDRHFGELVGGGDIDGGARCDAGHGSACSIQHHHAPRLRGERIG